MAKLSHALECTHSFMVDGAQGQRHAERCRTHLPVIVAGSDFTEAEAGAAGYQRRCHQAVGCIA
eukprot:363074-Chlamydomonas_euryale.AAC.17